MEPALREIATDDDPFLKEVADEVPEDQIKSDEIQQLLLDMVATMKNANGIGLAATQIRVKKRIMVFYLPPTRDEGGVGVPLTKLINPVVTFMSEDGKNSDFEGCLSVPGKRGKVQRYSHIRYSGVCGDTGSMIDREAHGWHARLVQHENDHLNGVVYTSLMDEEDRLMTVEEWKALQQ